MTKLTLEEKVNWQVEAANERHAAALRRQANRLMPQARAADDNLAVLCAESFAHEIVSCVAGEIAYHKLDQVEAVLDGKPALPMNLPAGTVLISEDRMNSLFDEPGQSKWCSRYFELTGLSFVDLLNQRLASAHERKLIPLCTYDGWEISIAGLAE